MKEGLFPLSIDVGEIEGNKGFFASIEWKPKNRKNYLIATGQGTNKISALKDATGAFIEGVFWKPTGK